MRIAVISDVHSVAAPFRRALADARSEGFDQLILLGDLFTYGVDPTECMDLAIEAIDQDGAFLVGGNHEQLYVDMRERRSAYFDKLPDWIRESVEWTWRELGETWPNRLEWIPEWAWGSLLFAHANPFGYGDWTYLSNDELLAAAAKTLRERGFRAGLFGHLHRPKHYRDETGTEVYVVNSTGQPRSKPKGVASWTMVELTGGKLTVEDRPIPFDVETHCAGIHAVNDLSSDTKTMLCRFYR
ncbi:MAG: metallophosphoesterase family protein [Pseudomonadota bacterium]